MVCTPVYGRISSVSAASADFKTPLYAVSVVPVPHTLASLSFFGISSALIMPFLI
jgi:hypothetical protein